MPAFDTAREPCAVRVNGAIRPRTRYPTDGAGSAYTGRQAAWVVASVTDGCVDDCVVREHAMPVDPAGVRRVGEDA